MSREPTIAVHLGLMRDRGSRMADDLGVAPEESSSFATPQEPAASGLRSTWPWLVLIGVIVVVAAVLRFWELGRQSMWLDELYTFNATAYGPVNAIRATSRDTNPPLFYVLQSFSLMALGRSEWAMRALSALAGVLATGVMYLAGAKLLNRRTGAWAAAMFAVSLLAVRYAQEARMYSLVMLIAALELWLFARLLERPTVTRAVLLGVAIGALAYTHVYGYIAAPMLLVPVLLLPRIRKQGRDLHRCRVCRDRAALPSVGIHYSRADSARPVAGWGRNLVDEPAGRSDREPGVPLCRTRAAQRCSGLVHIRRAHLRSVRDSGCRRREPGCGFAGSRRDP